VFAEAIDRPAASDTALDGSERAKLASCVAEVVYVARFSEEDRHRFAAASGRANVRAVFLETSEACHDLLQEEGVVPVCMFVDPSVAGTESLIAWVRGNPRWMGLSIIGIVPHPSEGAYARAHAIGVDDVVLRTDEGGATRRLAALGTESRAAPLPPSRGRAWIGHPNQLRRRLVGRVLRQAGYEVFFAGGRLELMDALMCEPEAELVVLAEELFEDDEHRLIDNVRQMVGKPDLPAVVLRAPVPTDHTGRTIGRVAVLADETAADNLLFVVNEVCAKPRGELRASQRLLFSTLCAFRRAHEVSPEFGLTYNVSREGLYVRTVDPPPRGTNVWLELRPPGATAIVHLRAEVMWARTAKPGSPGAMAPSGFGVRILEEECPPTDLERYRLSYNTFRDEPRAYAVEGHCRPEEPEGEKPVSGEVVIQVPEAETRTKGSVLVADDEQGVLQVYRRVLKRAGYQVTVATDGATALARFSRGRFDAVVTDIGMPPPNGVQLLRMIHEVAPNTPVIIATGSPSMETAIEAVEHGAFRYLRKPFEAADLRNIVGRAVQLGRLARLKQEAMSLHGNEISSANEDENAGFDSALDQLFLVYQPIVSWKSKSVYGYEALVRSKEASLPHPGALFGAAEKLGRVEELGRIIRNIAPDPFGALGERNERLFVNLHPGDLLDDELFSSRSPLAALASQVTLEITERASLSEIPDVKGRIASLRDMGFTIAVDDMGAGYAGLTSFAQLEPDVAKLDMSLIRDVHKVPTKQRLIRSFCEICADVGIALIAEGVETVEERDKLLELGCDLFQGYLFARPGLPFVEPKF